MDNYYTSIIMVCLNPVSHEIFTVWVKLIYQATTYIELTANNRIFQSTRKLYYCSHSSYKNFDNFYNGLI